MNRKYPCSNLLLRICSIGFDDSKLIFHGSGQLEIGTSIGWKFFFSMKFRSIGNDYSSGWKLLVKTTYRRALDPSENGTSRGRFEISMPNGSQNRRIEIPIEWLVGCRKNFIDEWKTSRIICIWKAVVDLIKSNTSWWLSDEPLVSSWEIVESTTNIAE